SRSGEELVLELRAENALADPERLAERLGAVATGVRVVDREGRLAASRGPGAVQIQAGGASFRVSVSSFFQGNRHLLDAFLEEVRAAIADAAPPRGGALLDLYAGVGFLTRPLLETDGVVTAVEIDASAAADLAANLATWRAEGLPAG